MQQELDNLKTRTYFDTHNQDKLDQLEAKYKEDYSWFTQKVQDLEIELKSTKIDLYQRTMLLKEYDTKRHEQSEFKQAQYCDSDDEVSVERANHLLRSEMKKLVKQSSIHDEELMSAQFTINDMHDDFENYKRQIKNLK